MVMEKLNVHYLIAYFCAYFYFISVFSSFYGADLIFYGITEWYIIKHLRSNKL